MNHPISVAESALLEAVAEIFAGAAPSASAETDASLAVGDLIVATIGFGGVEMRGAITLTAPITSWWSLAPAAMGIGADTEGMLCDMVGELSNMLAARFRSAFLRLGVEIAIATPPKATLSSSSARRRAARRDG